MKGNPSMSGNPGMEGLLQFPEDAGLNYASPSQAPRFVDLRVSRRWQSGEISAFQKGSIRTKVSRRCTTRTTSTGPSWWIIQISQMRGLWVSRTMSGQWRWAPTSCRSNRLPKWRRLQCRPLRPRLRHHLGSPRPPVWSGSSWPITSSFLHHPRGASAQRSWRTTAWSWTRMPRGTGHHDQDCRLAAGARSDEKTNRKVLRFPAQWLRQLIPVETDETMSTPKDVGDVTGS